MHALMLQLAQYYIAEVVGGLHREGDWNDNQHALGCIAGP